MWSSMRFPYLSSHYFSFFSDRTKRPSGSEEFTQANSNITENNLKSMHNVRKAETHIQHNAKHY